ncbi:OPT superfamily oligopeptide transporter [Dothidotthia symphoricarpi CBS 119687]|uniref:OPT superfamily oligopeptide transporter n=1 Tax=Dothidotthia symphoricarpi CBS 119687 TaxID=1392245 RepID=A0A6A6AGV6_9PLEO|nr:OPT superfamily oligopeptide transporter [Dothidotthia symphoricarpi CBS 119687]KAF2130473.1 OPT superfamily oligopeptide transporter [Dothidotthia symphoricarpi CBS 119687]
MAPDRGSPPIRTRASNARDRQGEETEDNVPNQDISHSLEARRLAHQASQPQNFTLRGVLVGLAIGVVICFSNMYFGLQTGWVSGMAMPSALIGFAYFKVVARTLKFPFTPVENVLVQSVAGSVGTMPLGCGFVGVIPALNYLLREEENGPLDISLWRLIVWSVGICFFGVVFAVPLRREMIIREKLKFPSGTATALLIKVLHGDEKGKKSVPRGIREEEEEGEEQGLLQRASTDQDDDLLRPSLDVGESTLEEDLGEDGDWKAKMRLLLISFAGSALYTVVSYFIPHIHDIPIFGLSLAKNWLWSLNPSPAYVGQGIIMGPATTLHMLLGAIIGWGVLSPLAKYRGWAPGPVPDWTNGSKGWIVWISLAIMLADSLVSLGWLVFRPLVAIVRLYYPAARSTFQSHTWKDLLTLNITSTPTYTQLSDGMSTNPERTLKPHLLADPEPDAPPEHLISNRTTIIGLIASLVLCTVAVHISFPSLIPLRLTLLALLLALLLSVMGVRALGETDLNPVSGISKLTQLVFALVTPKSKNAVIINLVAGAISESAALQAGDLLQDLKCGHLLGAAPNAQFWGQMIGSAVGAVLSAVVYKLYTHVYTIPGGLFEVPTGYVWVFTARLVTGQGLPPMVVEWASGAAIIFAVGTGFRVWGNTRKRNGLSGWWIDFIPGGIAVAVGMYNTPSFTLARTIGGLLSLWWRRWKGRSETPIIVLASGLILGEGLFSIVNLLLASLNVPHL